MKIEAQLTHTRPRAATPLSLSAIALGLALSVALGALWPRAGTTPIEPGNITPADARQPLLAGPAENKIGDIPLAKAPPVEPITTAEGPALGTNGPGAPRETASTGSAPQPIAPPTVVRVGSTAQRVVEPIAELSAGNAANGAAALTREATVARLSRTLDTLER